MVIPVNNTSVRLVVVALVVDVACVMVGAAVLATVMVPAALVMVIPLPAVNVAAIGAVPVEPINN